MRSSRASPSRASSTTASIASAATAPTVAKTVQVTAGLAAPTGPLFTKTDEQRRSSRCATASGERATGMLAHGPVLSAGQPHDVVLLLADATRIGRTVSQPRGRSSQLDLCH